MVFSSHIFLFYFLPLVLALYYAIPVRRYRMAMQRTLARVAGR
jgi:hypothetical protein